MDLENFAKSPHQTIQLEAGEKHFLLTALTVRFTRLCPGRRSERREERLPLRQAQVDEHHPEVGGEVGREKVPVVGPVEVPHLRNGAVEVFA